MAPFRLVRTGARVIVATTLLVPATVLATTAGRASRQHSLGDLLNTRSARRQTSIARRIARTTVAFGFALVAALACFGCSGRTLSNTVNTALILLLEVKTTRCTQFDGLTSARSEKFSKWKELRASDAFDWRTLRLN